MTNAKKPRFDDVGPDAGDVRAMFADVAPRYDLVNRTLSGGVDVLWRKRTIKRALHGLDHAPRVLDVCSGTGDLALAFERAACDVVGADFCREMIYCGEDKRRRAQREGLRFVVADAQRLPFDDDAFDVAAVAFGIRNVHDPCVALREMARVVRPGGRVLVLEFSRPRSKVIGPLYLWYFRKILPRIGKWIAPAARKHAAYDYLPESVMRFPEREDFCALMGEAGLVDARYELLSFGIASLYQARVPA